LFLDGLRASNSYHYETGKGQKVPNFYYGNSNRGGQLKQAQQPDPYSTRSKHQTNYLNLRMVSNSIFFIDVARSANRPYNDYPGIECGLSYPFGLIVMGGDKKFLTWVGSGQPSMVWVWKISPKNVKFFNFFPSG